MGNSIVASDCLCTYVLACMHTSHTSIEIHCFICGTGSGINHLCSAMSKLSHGLVELNLSRTGLGSRSIGRVVESLQLVPSIHLTLRRLDLSFNSVRGEEIGVSCCHIFTNLRENTVLPKIDLNRVM